MKISRSNLTPPQSRLLARIRRCDKYGYALSGKNEERMAKVLESKGLITIARGIAREKKEMANES
jgi:hypothetical protein